MRVMEVLAPGLLTTVQDLGREGFGPLGVSPSGAADPVALRIGNRLVGNAESAAALEMTLLGRRTGRSNGLGFRCGTGGQGCSAVDFVRSEAWPNASAGTNAFRRPVLFVHTRRNRREAVSRKRLHASSQRSWRLRGQSLAQRRRAREGRLRWRNGNRPSCLFCWFEPHSSYEWLQKSHAKDPRAFSAAQDPARHLRPAKRLVFASGGESPLWRNLPRFRRGQSHGSQAPRPAHSRRCTRRND